MEALPSNTDTMVHVTKVQVPPGLWKQINFYYTECTACSGNTTSMTEQGTMERVLLVYNLNDRTRNNGACSSGNTTSMTEQGTMEGVLLVIQPQ